MRNEIKNGSTLGKEIETIINKGDLVSDVIVGNLIEKYLTDDIYKNKIIFDGYPRNLNQAKNLNNLLEKNNQKIHIVLKLSVKLETIKRRILERKNLEKRADDNLDIAIKRFETYENNIKSVIDFYKKSNLLKVINGEGSIDEISDKISGLIDGIKG